MHQICFVFSLYSLDLKSTYREAFVSFPARQFLHSHNISQLRRYIQNLGLVTQIGTIRCDKRPYQLYSPLSYKRYSWIFWSQLYSQLSWRIHSTGHSRKSTVSSVPKEPLSKSTIPTVGLDASSKSNHLYRKNYLP